jgi:hypothetical protein
MTLARGHHAQTGRTARNFFIFHTVAVRLIKNCTLLFLTGEDDIARFDSQRYSYKEKYVEFLATIYFTPYGYSISYSYSEYSWT